MEEPFAIIPIGLIKDCVEIIDMLLKIEKKSTYSVKSLLKAKRLLDNLPKSPRKESFEFKVYSTYCHYDKGRKEWTMELNSDMLLLEETRWSMNNTRDTAGTGETNYSCLFKRSDTKCKTKQFKYAKNWLKSTYNELMKASEKDKGGIIINIY